MRVTIKPDSSLIRNPTIASNQDTSSCDEPVYPLVLGNLNEFNMNGFNMDNYGNLLVAGASKGLTGFSDPSTTKSKFIELISLNQDMDLSG